MVIDAHGTHRATSAAFNVDTGAGDPNFLVALQGYDAEPQWVDAAVAYRSDTPSNPDAILQMPPEADPPPELLVALNEALRGHDTFPLTTDIVEEIALTQHSATVYRAPLAGGVDTIVRIEECADDHDDADVPSCVIGLLLVGPEHAITTILPVEQEPTRLDLEGLVDVDGDGSPELVWSRRELQRRALSVTRWDGTSVQTLELHPGG